MTRSKEAKEQIDQSASIMVFASGMGTNFQEIIKAVENGSLSAKISGLVTNNADSGALHLAKKNEIPYNVISSKGALRDSEKRKQFEEEIYESVAVERPDIIVLAGWMLVLSDNFIVKTNSLGIKIINLHPAILSEDAKDNITIPMLGSIPILRGVNAIERAYNLNLPFSGVTVHEVVPGPYDVGPIIEQIVVFRDDGETPESWEAKMHRAEHILLPIAIGYVINSVGNG
jgi:phosphoribosylglycinamide formyltransferase-1